MKFFVVALCLFAVAAAAPSSLDVLEARRRLPALEHEETHDESGQFVLRYVTAEGTRVMERGQLVPSQDGSGDVMVVAGEVSYIGDDGKTYITKYTAGVDGTHVEGDHLPVSVTSEPIAEPVDIAADPVDIAADPVEIAAEPVEIAAVPIDFAVEPVEIVAAPIFVAAKPAEVIVEPVNIIAEPFKAIDEPFTIVSEWTH